MIKSKGRPRADQVEERNQHILAVAEALIVRDGYQAVSVDDIARAAQISKKTIYTQFQNKAGLLAAVVDRLARNLSVTLSSSEHQDLREGLLHRANVILDASYDPTTIRFDIVLFREGRMFPELRRTFERAAQERYIGPVEDYLAACAARGLIRGVDPAFAAQSFVYLLTADIIVRASMGEAPHMPQALRRAHAERVCDLFLRGIETPAQAQVK